MLHIPTALLASALTIAAAPSLALADPVDLASPVEAPSEAASPAITLDALRAEADAGGGSAAALVDAAATLLDEGADLAARKAAAHAIAGLGDTRGLVFLAAASRERLPELQVEALGAAAAFRGPEAVAQGRRRLEEVAQPVAVRDAAIGLLVALDLPEAGQALLAVAEDRSLTNAVRADALDAVKAAYPELLEGREAPQVARTVLGNLIFSAASGVAGGVALSSIGEWGQLDAGAAIGAAGGGAVGAGVGALYARQRQLTLGQGMIYGSAVGWGLDLGERAALATQASDNVAAGLRVAGVAGGMGTGLWGMSRDPDPMSVVEVDTAGWLGAELAAGVTHLGLSLAAGERGVYSTRPLSTAALGGAALGLSAGALLKDRWTLDLPQALYGGVVAAELGWVGIWVPEIADRYWIRGTARIGAHGGAALGLVVAHRMGATLDHAAYGAWGMALGNALGAGLPMLLGSDQDPVVLGTMAGLGVAGVAVGTAVGPRVDPSPGDHAMVGIGTTLAALEGLSLGYVLDQKGYFQGNQHPGLALTAGAIAGVSFTALGREVDPEPGDMIFLGTAAGWGAWYGVMTPLALDLEGSREDLILATTLTADAFLAAGGALISPWVDLNVRRTLIPQLGGFSGATLGALGVALFTTEGKRVAQGAVIGSTAGLVAGVGLDVLLHRRRPQASLSLSMPSGLRGARSHLILLPAVSPWTDEEGQPGLYFSIEGRGI